MYYGLCTAKSPQKNCCQFVCAFCAFLFLPSLDFGSPLLLVLRRRPLLLVAVVIMVLVPLLLGVLPILLLLQHRLRLLLVVVIVVLVLFLRAMPLILLLLVLRPVLRVFRLFPHPLFLVSRWCVVVSLRLCF